MSLECRISWMMVYNLHNPNVLLSNDVVSSTGVIQSFIYLLDFKIKVVTFEIFGETISQLIPNINTVQNSSWNCF